MGVFFQQEWLEGYHLLNTQCRKFDYKFGKSHIIVSEPWASILLHEGLQKNSPQLNKWCLLQLFKQSGFLKFKFIRNYIKLKEFEPITNTFYNFWYLWRDFIYLLVKLLIPIPFSYLSMTDFEFSRESAWSGSSDLLNAVPWIWLHFQSFTHYLIPR